MSGNYHNSTTKKSQNHSFRMTGSEQERMLHEIGMIDFVIIEMNLYLDTHPTDRNAIEYFNHYVRLKNQAMRDYGAKYGPLTLSTADNYSKDWQWAMQPWPWEGVC